MAELPKDMIYHFYSDDGITIKLDAMKLVRCGECKHRDPEDKKCDYGHGIIWQLPRDDNWFCADGKRRDEDETLER